MTRTTQRWLAGIVVGTALAVGVPAAPAWADEHADTRTTLEEYNRKAGPGAAVHAGKGTESWTLSSGSASIREDRPITSADHFRIGSQTKTFTAVVVLQLAEEGLVELDAPVEEYLPGVLTMNYDGNEITVRQLLNHTAGLPREPSGAAPEPDGTYELAALVRAAMDDPPVSEPGGSLNYSNVGYMVLGMLIEKSTGRYVGDAITERIIEPLGLTGTSFPAPGQRALPAPYVPGYQGGRLLGMFFWFDATTLVELSRWSSSGAMASTMEDMVRFYRALMDGELVSERMLADMRTTVPIAPGSQAGYGLGLYTLPLSCGGAAWGHDGLLATGHASITMVTDDGRFASVLTNANIVAREPAAADVVDAALCEGES
ncbi:serine hydrolase domain-containing protein [Amycolatopsis aidingensis]|uniref:serine hydrolase domain-containing protein n=1 Tax=Amycolatopsis aidingensis TaxID=2842453 RepID=UPI001C0CD269|nr:serine hydrolase domain-containing protein [Amycolatopsis aidingensis]